MLKAAKNITAGLMMAILFAVSSGFTLFSHVCLMGGNQEISSKEIVSCCSDETQNTTTQLSSDCCNDHIQFIKFDFTSLTTQYQLQHQFISTDLISLSLNTGFEELNSSFLFFNNLPPPKSGREILSSKQVFRI